MGWDGMGWEGDGYYKIIQSIKEHRAKSIQPTLPQVLPRFLHHQHSTYFAHSPLFQPTGPGEVETNPCRTAPARSCVMKNKDLYGLVDRLSPSVYASSTELDHGPHSYCACYLVFS